MRTARMFFGNSYGRFCMRTSSLFDEMSEASGLFSTDYSTHVVSKRAMCSIESLRFNIQGLGRVPIWDTPHYKFWAEENGEQMYQKYISEFYGPKEGDVAVERYRDLRRHLREHPELTSLLGRVCVPFVNWILIIDGTHRAALAAHQEVNCLEVLITNS